MSTIVTKIRYYVKIAKFNVVWLLDLAALGGAFLDFGSIDLIKLIAVLIGGTLASSGSMMINQALEVNRDALMSRTSRRPTVKGLVSPKNVLVIGILLTLLGVSISFIANLLSALMVILGALFYVVIYTILLKPRTYWNIVIGGLAGSFAAWAGYFSQHEYFSLSALILGLLVFMWTPGHFWALALRYKEDYKRAGIPMLPVVLNDDKKSAYSIMISNLLMIPFAIFISLFNLYFTIYTIILSIILFYFNIRLLKRPTKEEAWISFKVTSPYLAFILLGIIVFSII
jgi:protoheme IX farnesyltransferase